MISIIIPTLNEEKIIEKTLKNLREFHGDYEIIVSDGKSKDKTVEISKKYADKVVVYEGEDRQNIAMGRNLGATKAVGNLLLFLDADVFIPDINNFFKNALKILNDKNLAGLTVCLRVFPELATFFDNFIFTIVNYLFYISNNIFHYGMASGEFQMIRADMFKKINGYNEKLVGGEDIDLFKRLSQIGHTQIESTLFVFHTSRRAHKIGWPKLLFLWFKNWFYANFFNKSWNSVWEEIR